MRIHLVRLMLRTGAAVALVLVGLCCAGMAQEIALLQPDAPLPTATFEPAPASTPEPAPAFTPAFNTVQPFTVPRPTEVHRFWDRENSLLFAATAAFSTADFVVTRDNLRSGGQEFNPLTRVISGSTAGLAMNFAGETAGVLGLSYFFHRTGHHKLERAVSMVNIGGSGAAVAFGLMHR